jgi:hypothetical protein
MREFFIVFRSRSEAVRFYEMLIGYRVPSKIMNTPSSAGIGCGLSVKMFSKDMSKAKVVIERGKFNSVAGFFYLSQNGAAIRI